jgi:hypothetical protein
VPYGFFHDAPRHAEAPRAKHHHLQEGKHRQHGAAAPGQMVLGLPSARSKVDKGFPRHSKEAPRQAGQADGDFCRPPPAKNLGTKEHHHQASPPSSRHHHSLAFTIPSLLEQWPATYKVVVHDIAGTGDSSSAATRKEPTSTTPKASYHRQPTASDHCCPRNTATWEKEGPDPLSMTRVMVGRRHRGFTWQPLPGSQTEGGGWRTEEGRGLISLARGWGLIFGRVFLLVHTLHK